MTSSQPISPTSPFVVLGVLALLLLWPLYQGGTLPGAMALGGVIFVFVFVGSVWRPGPADLSWLWPWLAFSLVVGWQAGLAVSGDGAAWHTYRPGLQLLESWVLFSAYWFSAMVISGLNRRSMRVLLMACFALGVFEAAYGMVALLGGHDSILGIWPRGGSTGTHLTGTFINRNHAADFLSICWLLGLGGVLAVAHRRVITTTATFVLVVSISVVMGVALFATQSRLGLVSAGVGVLSFALLLLRDTARQVRRVALGLAGLVGFTLMAGVWFGLGDFVTRFLALSDNASSRAEIWFGMFDLPWQAWLLGIGANQFEDVYKLYQPLGLLNTYPEAHNDYLQFLLEFGLLGSALVIGSMIWWGRRCWAGPLGVIQKAALCGVIVVVVHSVAGFSLQVPGVAFLFWVCVGMVFNPRLAGRNR